MKLKVKKKKRRPTLEEVEQDYWAQLQNFSTNSDAEEAIRSLPNDMAEALQLEPAMFLMATATLPSLFAHWTTKLAYAKSRHTAAKHAREIGLEALKSDQRQILRRLYEKVTEPMINERAKASEEYARLCVYESKAEREWLRVKGLVDTLAAKKEALRIISFFLKPEMDLAAGSYSIPDLSQITQVTHSPDMEAMLKTNQDSFDEKVRKNGE